MGSLLVMLLLWPQRPIPTTSTSEGASTSTVNGDQADLTMRAKRAGQVVAGEALGALLALLVVVSCVLFFYLFCLPWMGVK
jgi:hypothetical protein